MHIVGGRAHINGVEFISDSHIAVVTTKRTKIIRYNFSKIKLIHKAFKIPVIRSLLVLLRMDLRMILLLFFLGVFPWDQIVFIKEFSFPMWSEWLSAGASLLLIRFVFKEIWKFHGAEHKVYNAYLKNRELTLDKVKNESRVSKYCGTNLAVFILGIYLMLSMVFPNSDFINILISFLLGFETFRFGVKFKLFLPIFKLGMVIQKYIFTIEPEEKHLKIALSAIDKALNSYPGNE